MISHRYRCIFVHDRKAAGISIMSAFGLDHADREWHLYNEGVLAPEWFVRPDYFIFTIVRNPFDRLISAWRYLPATRDRPLIDVLTNPPTRGRDYRHLTRPQVAILRDPRSGALVTDAVIRLEDLQAGFDQVCDRIGKPRCVLPHLNKTRRERDYRSYFDQRTRQMAELVFKDDLEALNYSF